MIFNEKTKDKELYLYLNETDLQNSGSIQRDLKYSILWLMTNTL